MPVVSVSLSEVGYEGYKELPKGRRSMMIDRMLRDWALDSHIVNIRDDRGMITSRRSMREIGDSQVMLNQRIESYIIKVEKLEEENKKLRGEEE